MTDLTNCIGKIVIDDDVREERIKNRMSADYDARVSHG